MFSKMKKYLLLIAVFAACNAICVRAENDDPGNGRLSGTDIPVEFYENIIPQNSDTTANLNRYGNAETKSPYTNKTYIHRAEYADRPITHGIDVSEWQGEIDWAKVKANGILYAFIRVGYRGSTQGALNDDAYYKKNIENALAAGVEVGVYIFSQAITKEEAVEEAEYLLERIKDYHITFPVVLDYEFTSGTGRLEAADLSKKKATEVCLAFCETIENAGYTPMVYANPDMLMNHLNPSDISANYSIWLANYTTQTNYTGDYDYWQYSSDGSVDGIKGRVDMNFFYGTDIANSVIAPVADSIYTGKQQKPGVTITYNEVPLIQDVDYVLTYTNNKKVGTASITITGIGTFYGTQTLEFKITPRPVTSLQTKKKSSDYLLLSWDKDTSISGYQIYRSDSIDGKYKKITTIKNKSTKTYKDENVKNGQCYYYKIRSYKTINGAKWYSSFSDIVTAYTKTGYTRTAIAKKQSSLYATAAISDIPVITPAKGDSLSVIYATKDKEGNPWYRVSYKKDGETYKGFVPGKKLTITQIGKVTGTGINVRKSYSTSSKVLTTLNKNKKVTIIKTKKNKDTTWYQITFSKKGKNYKGWIAAQFIKLL